ncbi:efflux RND transporter periplasmic adaptor subunit [Shewanella sp. VB17]|uniref:efflux RND transporter periplasmic adaptor subunit n=1 Tax=Shewanella sp. VB17 TaxID=2739432 RepID=UPI0015636F21|nr:efflux RND transporter periplasmic adaptor subunit [Shewanella sp. VB17]NRD74963.1 efflux RND transporter periplasmic adaptor subunit [Shewanella sp. VB17]
MKKSLIVIPFITLVILMALLSGLFETKTTVDKESRGPRVVPVVTGMVAQHLLSQTISLIGKLAADKSVFIASEVAGKIKAIQVAADQEIQAGQILIQLEDARSQASMSEANAYLNDEKRKLIEFKKLITKNAITQTEIDAQQASVDIAVARLAAAKAELDFHYIKAPFTGTAGLLDFSLGKMVAIGSELLTLDDLSSMRLDLQVPENYLSQLNVGMTVSAINSAWPSEVFTGLVVAIDPRINQETLSLKVRVNFDNHNNKLKPGMLMSARLDFPAVSEPVIPVQAIEYSGTKRFVYVIGEDELATRTQVILGARIKDEVVISEGVDVGQKIVVQGLVNMRDGLKVNDLSVMNTERMKTKIIGDKGDES